MPDSKPLVINQENQLMQLFPRPPLLTSFLASWHGICLNYFREPAQNAPEVSSSRWHSILMFPSATAPIHANRTLDGCKKQDSVIKGDIVITPTNVGHRSCWKKEHDFVVIAIESSVLARAVEESAQPEQITLLPHFATPDPLVFQIGLALKGVLENNAASSRLYAETMANALAVHLLQNYCVRKPSLREYTGGLVKHRLQLVIDYINQHLEQDLGLVELAAVVQMSPHYFTRLFKQSVGLAPHQYVIRCRVERAKELLLQGNLTIAEVAYSVGFANQSHLNRHCKRLLGVTPKTIQQG